MRISTGLMSAAWITIFGAVAAQASEIQILKAMPVVHQQITVTLVRGDCEYKSFSIRGIWDASLRCRLNFRDRLPGGVRAIELASVVRGEQTETKLWELDIADDSVAIVAPSFAERAERSLAEGRKVVVTLSYLGLPLRQ